MLYRKHGMHASNSIYTEKPSLHKASSHSFIDRPINCWHIKQHKECIGHHKNCLVNYYIYNEKAGHKVCLLLAVSVCVVASVVRFGLPHWDLFRLPLPSRAHQNFQLALRMKKISQ